MNLSSHLTFAQSLNFDEAIEFHGTPFVNVGIVTMDDEGNYYAVGTFRDSLDIDPGPSVLMLYSDKVLTGTGNLLGAYCFKMSASNEILWAKSYSAPFTASSLEFDLRGNLMILGTSYGSMIETSPQRVQHYSRDSRNLNDVFLMKYSPNGALIWSKYFGGDGHDWTSKVKQDGSGNIWIIGGFKNNCNFNTDTNGFVFNINAPQGAGFVSKLDSLGNFIWAGSFGNQHTSATSLGVDSKGDVLIAGSFSGEIDVSPDLFPHNIRSVGPRNGFFVKINSSGSFEWAKVLAGIGNVHISDMSIDKNDLIYTTGYFSKIVDFDLNEYVTRYRNAKLSTQSFLYVVTDTIGFVDLRTFGGVGYGGPESRSILRNESGNLFIKGTFDSESDFDPGAAENIRNSIFGNDLFISEFDENLNYYGTGFIQGEGHNHALARLIDETFILPHNFLHEVQVEVGDMDERFEGPNKTNGIILNGIILKYSIHEPSSLIERSGLGIQLFPNPTKESFALTADIEGVHELRLLDSKGSFLRELQKGKTWKFLPQESQGLYFLEYKSDDGLINHLRIVRD